MESLTVLSISFLTCKMGRSIVPSLQVGSCEGYRCKHKGSVLGHQLCNLDKVLDFCMPQFPCLQNRDNDPCATELAAP